MSAIEQSFKNVMAWIDDRLPVTEAYEKHLSKYYAPKNLNIWYYFGIFSFLVLANQLLTGIWLTMSYVPTGEEAFASVEYIMRDVEYGWMLRYMHSTGASAFFVVVYLHMFRGLLYGSYQKPRELIWILGMLIYIALMAEGFFGYLLPWGNMSFWGAQVIVSLASAIPLVGGSSDLGSRRFQYVWRYVESVLCAPCRSGAFVFIGFSRVACLGITRGRV